MKILANFVVLCSLFLTIFVPTTFAAVARPEPIGEINKEDPSWSEEIIIERNARERSDGTLVLPGGSITVGPQANQIQFPDLREINDALTNSFPYLLPEELRQQFQAAPPKEESLTGKIFHPVCNVRVRGQNREVAGAVPSTGSSVVTTPPWWSHLLGVTQLSQAINVPGQNSGAGFGAPPEIDVNDLADSEENQAGDCETATGPENGIVEQATNQGATTINIGTLFESIIGFLSGLLEPGDSVPVEIVIKAKKFVPGESDFARQASDKMGFLRAWCPQDLCPKQENINEQEETPYIAEGDNAKLLEYQGVAGARKGYDLLVESIYPVGVEVQRPIPSGPSIPREPGVGIFKLTGNPLSPRLETIIRDAARSFDIPPAILSAVAWIEGPSMWNLSETDINAYSAPGAQMPQNCQPNGCGARGPMQFVNGGVATDCGIYTGTTMGDSWAPYSNAVNEATSGSRTTNVCNILDSIYAAGKKLKANSGATSADWTEGEANNAGSGYHGNCYEKFPRLGDRTYCGFLWDNYK